MSHYSKIFNKVPVRIPNRSGFDLSHENLFTAKCGTLYPVLVDTIIPGDSFSLGQSSQIQLPPMATDFYGRVMGKFEAFFVPFRVLYGGWQELITHPVSGDNYPDGTNVGSKAKYLPTIVFPKANCLAGSLADFVGRRADSSSIDTSSATEDFRNPLPFLAYHKIWNDWYRDSRIQAPAFAKYISGDRKFYNLPFITNYGDSPLVLGVISFNKSKLDSMIVDVGNMYKNKESNDEINKFIKKNDSGVSVSFDDQGKYFDVTLSKNYEFITPGMSSILKNFKIDVERTMYNEEK